MPTIAKSATRAKLRASYGKSEASVAPIWLDHEKTSKRRITADNVETGYERLATDASTFPFHVTENVDVKCARDSVDVF